MVESSHTAQQSPAESPAGTSSPSPSQVPSRGRPSARRIVAGRPFDEQVQMLAPRRPVQRDLPRGRSGAEPGAQNEAEMSTSALQVALEQLHRDQADHAVSIPVLMARADAASDAMIGASQEVIGRALAWATSEGEEAIRRFEPNWGAYGLGVATSMASTGWSAVRRSSPIGAVLGFVFHVFKGYYDNMEQQEAVDEAVADAAYASGRAAVAQHDAIRQVMLGHGSWVSSIGRIRGRFEQMFGATGYAHAIEDLQGLIASPTTDAAGREHRQAGELSAEYARLKDSLTRQVAGMGAAIGQIRSAGNEAINRIMIAFLKHKTDNRIQLSGYVQTNSSTFELHVSFATEMSREMTRHVESLTWNDLRHENIATVMTLQNMATTPYSQVTLMQIHTGGRSLTGDTEGLGALVHWMRRPDPAPGQAGARRRELSGIAQNMIWGMLDGSPMRSHR